MSNNGPAAPEWTTCVRSAGAVSVPEMEEMQQSGEQSVKDGVPEMEEMQQSGSANCPNGYTSNPDDIIGNGNVAHRGHLARRSATTLDLCAAACEAHTGCFGFEHNPQPGRYATCYLAAAPAVMSNN